MTNNNKMYYRNPVSSQVQGHKGKRAKSIKLQKSENQTNIQPLYSDSRTRLNEIH